MSGEEILKELISLPEAAKRLGLHRATVNDMVITGRLKGYRLGAHWFVRRPDLEAFAHGYQRPRNAPRRRSSRWSESWQAEIMRWLGHWDSATTDELSRVLDLHIGNIRKYLVMLEQDGLAHRDDDGFWRLTEDGRNRAGNLPPIAA